MQYDRYDEQPTMTPQTEKLLTRLALLLTATLIACGIALLMDTP